MRNVFGSSSKVNYFQKKNKRHINSRLTALLFAGAFLSGLAFFQLFTGDMGAHAYPTFTEYSPPTASSGPQSIATGPDGALWFSESQGNKIGRVTTAGVFNEYTIPTANSTPSGITSGPDGALWFTETNADKIGRITTAGTITEFPLNDAGSRPIYITTGPDGNLWFTGVTGNLVGRITTAGTITEFPLASGSGPQEIVSGPNGALWFTEHGTSKIGEMTTSGTLTEYPIPGGGNPTGIAVGSDGAVWFADTNANSIGRITSGGTISEYTVPTSSSSPFGITSGADGALWFAELNGNNIGRISTSGSITEYNIPTVGSNPLNITSGPDGSVWFTELSSGKIGSLTTSLSPRTPTNLTSSSPTQNPALSWSGSFTATSYNIYRNGIIVGSSTASNYTDTTAPQGSNSYYVTAVNSSGESAVSNTVSVLVDRTPPAITYTVSPAPNGAGWNDSPVTVTFTCSPTVSGVGVTFCTAPVTKSTNGANQIVFGTAVDAAGNSASVTASINLEKTGPTLGSPELSANPIVVGQSTNLSVPVSDNLSGVVGGEYFIGTTDPGVGNGFSMNWNGTALSASLGSSLPAGIYQVNMRAINNAGVWSSITTATLSVDPPAPTDVTAMSPTYKVPVLSWTAIPSASFYKIYRNGALTGTSSSASFTDSTAPQGSNSYYVIAVSAGSTESTQSNAVTVLFDTTPPTISYSLSTSPNSAGWFNSPVTVMFTCNTSVAGVTITACTSPVVLNTDGANQTVIGSATDSAGNTATATAAAINIDQTAPTLSAALLSANPASEGQTIGLNVPVTDATSGVIGGEYYIGNIDPGIGQANAMTFDGTNLTAAISGNLQPGSYVINIRAEDAAGNWSNVETTNLTVNAVTAPTNLSANSPTNQAPVLTWASDPDAASYSVYRNGVKIGTTNTTSYTDVSAPQGTNSYYVTAINASSIESAPSNSVSVVYDTTPPTITYTLSAAPNVAGWFNTPVTVTFTCSDSIVGIASCPSPVTFSNNGLSQTTDTTFNNAGGSASVTVSVNIDTGAPVLGTPGWSVNPTIVGQPTTVTVPATDSISGIVGGEYYVGGTDPGIGAGIPMSWDGTNLSASFGAGFAPGSYTISVRAENTAGNWSNVTSATLVVNPVAVPAGLSAPTPTNQAPVLIWASDPDAASYSIYRNNTFVANTANTSFTDSAAQTGTNTYYVVALSPYGTNSAPSNAVSVLYDTTKPTITYTVSPQPNAAGWNNTPVTISFLCNSLVTGVSVSTCSTPVSISANGANQSINGNVTDTAGNSNSITATVNVDQSAPVLGTPAWNANPVSAGTPISLTLPVTATLSGVAGGEYFIGTTDPGQGHAVQMTWNGTALVANFGSALTPGSYVVNFRAESVAGVWSSITASMLVVNPPAPLAPLNLAAISPTNLYPSLTWSPSSGATSYNVYRNGSKIGTSSATSYTDTIAPQGSNLYTVTAVNAGGESSKSTSVSVLYDTTPPTITYTLSQAPNAAGWENGSVTVVFNCGDAVTAITSCTQPVTVSTDGSGQSVTGTAVDAAGNTSSVTVIVNVDQTLPTVGSPTFSLNPIIAGQATVMSATASDNLSGVIGGEYFIGTTDPGQGHGTAMTLNSGNLTATLGSTIAPGTYQINVRDEDAAGNWSSLSTGTLVVNPATMAPVITSSASVTTATGSPFSFTVTTTGNPTPVLAESGALPANITFTSNGNGTATIAGTAAAGTNGIYPLTITATNSAGKVSQNITLTVTATKSAPKITSANTVTVKYGVAMVPFAVTTTGYPVAILSATGLPSGLKFADNGNGTAAITGTPNDNVYGLYGVTIKASNSVGSISQAFSLFVTKAPAFKSINKNKLIAVLGSPYTLTVNTTGYPTVTLSESGALPSNMKFVDNGNGTGTISGTPASGTTGNYTIKITATNSIDSITETFTLIVVQPPKITSANNAAATTGKTFSFQITSSGFPAPDYMIMGGLPKGLSYNTETGMISGTPQAGTAGTYKLQLYAYNVAGLASQTFTLTVQ